MKICNVVKIYDNDVFVSVITVTGLVIHLPKGRHSITIHDKSDASHLDITIDFYAN